MNAVYSWQSPVEVNDWWLPERWNQVDGNLYCGGHFRDDPKSPRWVPVIVGSEFDLVVSLFKGIGQHGPARGVREVYYPIPDGVLSRREIAHCWQIARQVVNALVAGKKVLVRCQAGLNRSGMVCAMVLILQGKTADEAIALVRAARSRNALSNPLFVDYLRRGEIPPRPEGRKAR